MAAPVNSYRDLLVWQKSMEVALQVRRSAISVASNIAEGRGRRSRGEFVRFVSIANGSLKELETQLLLLSRVDQEFEEETNQRLARTDEIGRMLNRLHHKLRADRRG